MAVVVSALANMGLGSLWYGPLFGKQWMALMGITHESINAQKVKNEMWKAYALAFVGSLAMAYVLHHVMVLASSYFGTNGIQTGLSSAFWSWLGFVAPVTLGSVLWEGKPWKLWWLMNSYYLLALLIMGSIIGAWM